MQNGVSTVDRIVQMAKCINATVHPPHSFWHSARFSFVSFVGRNKFIELASMLLVGFAFAKQSDLKNKLRLCNVIFHGS